MGSVLILEKTEQVKGIYSYFEAVSSSSGLLVLTSKKLILSPGTKSVRFGTVIEIPLATISGVTAEELQINGRRSPTLGVSASRKYLLTVGSTTYSSDPVSEIADAIQQLAQFERTHANDVKIVHVNIDFADLRKYMDQGGVVLRQVKCPSCGAPLRLPEQGSATTCEFCRATVVAEDIFEKIKDLIG